MYKKIIIIVLLVFFNLSTVSYSHAAWIWTRESGKWVNPKYMPKDSPKEQLEYSLEFFHDEKYSEAIKEFKKLIKHYPRARQAAEAKFYIGRSYEEMGYLFSAFKNYQEVIEKYPYSERAPEIIKLQYDIGHKILEGKDRRSKFIKVLYGSEHDAIEVFRAVIKNSPYGEYAAPSQYKIGLFLKEKELYQEAREEFEKTINDYPDTEWARAAKYQIALSDASRSSDAQHDQKVTEEAVREFEEFVEEYPDTEFSEEAQNQIYELRTKEAENKFLVASFYEKQKKIKSAKIYYSLIVNNYKDTVWAAKALEKLQELNLKENKENK